MIIDNGAYPSPLGYGNFPKSVCTSVNECICHGIPDSRPLEDGDIINIDVTVYLNVRFYIDVTVYIHGISAGTTVAVAFWSSILIFQAAFCHHMLEAFSLESAIIHNQTCKGE
ncbi:hypothetical protein K1719_004929 [Acacia pycnantha]|nr:hypothetical protein K1719_004929 [Acacia pycnantha]